MARQREMDLVRNRQLIVDAGIKVFAAHGFHAAKIEEIMDIAGFSKGTFYNYFRSKEALILEILKDKTEEIREGIEELSETDMEFGELMRSIARRKLEFFRSNESFFKMVFAGAMRDGQSLPSAMHENMHAFFRMFVDALSKIFERHSDKLRSDVSPCEAALIFMHITDVFLKRHFHSKDTLSICEDPDKMVSVFLNGLAGEGLSL